MPHSDGARPQTAHGNQEHKASVEVKNSRSTGNLERHIPFTMSNNSLDVIADRTNQYIKDADQRLTRDGIQRFVKSSFIDKRTLSICCSQFHLLLFLITQGMAFCAIDNLHLHAAINEMGINPKD